MRRTLQTARNSSLPLAFALASVLGAGMGMDDTRSGCLLAQEKLNSPVQAVTTIVERADGTVDVDLAVVSTADDTSRFVTTVTNAQVRVPSGALVTLRPAEAGHYRASTADDPALVYEPGRWRVTFELDDERAAEDVAGSEFIAVIEAPTEATEGSFRAPAFVGDTAELTWTPSSRDGLLEVFGPTGELVYSSFNWSTPEFDGSKWGSLLRNGSATLNVDVFTAPGTYRMRFCAVAVQEGFDEELSGSLGVLSGFLAGRCIADEVFTVSE
jgi:hypothetical protein